MGLPGGSKNDISVRNIKNWNLICYTTISDTNVLNIFSDITVDLFSS
jgi:hypothetical protein